MARATPPNILLITTDQQRHDTIHRAGNSHIFTPHLNWLMDQGVHFRRCYADSPVCVPGRATIMTGRHGFTNGLTSNAAEPVPMAVRPTLPGILTANGYQTRAAGKMHFHPVRGHYGFEHMRLLHDYYRHMARHPELGRPMDHGLGQNEMEPVMATVEESHSLTRWIVDESIDFLETRDPTRPFFLWTSFAKPHPPFDCDRKYWELYQDADIPPPVRGDWSQTVEDVPDGLMGGTYASNKVHRFSETQLKASKRAYYACISQIDYNLGCLFSRMRELGHLAGTWIIFTSDHGEMLGDHWMGAKGIFLEGSAHVPLIIRPPAPDWQGHPLQGQSCDALTSLADILPTCLAIAGIRAPEDPPSDGLDLLKVLAGEKERKVLCGACVDNYAVIENRYKYHFAARGPAELLFDLAEDPCERKELIRTGEPAGVIQRMREKMARFLTRHRPDAVQEGALKGLGPAPSEAECSGRLWPGFHSPAVETDVMH